MEPSLEAQLGNEMDDDSVILLVYVVEDDASLLAIHADLFKRSRSTKSLAASIAFERWRAS